MILIRSIFLAFTIWVLTALLNALLGGAWLSFFSVEFKDWPATFLLVFIFTLVLSIPGILIFWIVLLINRNESLLFRSLLKAGFIISALSSLMLYILPLGEVTGGQFFLTCSMVIASIASIMIHHPGIQSISKNKTTGNHA